VHTHEYKYNNKQNLSIRELYIEDSVQKQL